MHGYPVMQVVQYSVPPCSWPPVDSHRPSQPTSASQRSGIRKYVVWCLICGGLSCLLGIMFLGVYFLVRSYTSTIGYFETVPTFVPATLLMLTGLCIISLARRRNRYSYLIKLSGACGLSSALTCALVTVTTTVIHMSRLQALRECEYTRKTRTCTCYSVETHAMQDNSGNDEAGYRFVFDSADECTVVHNALYSCLRAIFGISVAGVLVAVFSCMLVYQLLSHERKKMIWEQLELRRRQAYGRQSPPGWPSLTNGPSIIGTPRNGACRCCEQCHSHRNMMQSSYAWDNDGRFWSPNGYYTQGSDDHTIVSRMVNQNSIQTQRPGWSWPRFPWQRNDANSNQRFRQTPSSPDSQYGFSSNMSRIDNANLLQSYTLINNPHHFSIWGPPPPYSDPNSPVRRNRTYPYSQCQPITDHSGIMLQPIQPSPNQTNLTTMDRNQPIVSEIHRSIEQMCATPTHTTHRIIKKNRFNVFEAKDSSDSATLSDSDTQRASNRSNTLPFRKARKNIDNGVKSIASHQPTARVNVQRVFSSTQIDCNRPHDTNIPSCSTPNYMHGTIKCGPSNGVENSGFQSIEDDRIINVSPPENYTNDNERTIITNNNRDLFSRSRLQFTTNRDHENIGDSYNGSHQPLPLTSPRNHHISSNSNSNSSHSLPKDLTRYSICSAESGEKTDYTDLSPMTPSTPYTNTESNAITLAFQREMKQQQQQQQQQQHQSQQITSPHNNIYTDHSDAASSNATQTYTTRYFDSIDHKRDLVAAANSNASMRRKNAQEIHLRPTLQHANAVTNHSIIPSMDSGATSLDNLNASEPMLQKFERRSVYQRPTYSFASAHNTPRHNNNVKHNLLSVTPKKRNVYATQSLGTNSNATDMTIDLMRLTSMRNDNNNKSDNSKCNNTKSEWQLENKASDDSNIWPGHTSSDVRL